MPENFGWESIDLASAPALLPGEVHIYATLLAPDERWQAEAERTLQSSERERAARFRFEEDRYRFQKTRCLLRHLLAHYLETTPTEIKFHEGVHGKPYLKESGSALQFNVSHTRGAAVLAFTDQIEVGIDIEHSRRRVDVDGIGRKVFTTKEQASLRDLGSASALRQFFRLWTAKEAYLKATGSGMSCNPASIEADFENRRYTSVESPGLPLPYILEEIESSNQFQVSLAHQAGAARTIRKIECR
ncbi:MAG: 4'-phosphopantetheinyl transferase [Verrucomicrobiales bacterium]|jgi:4'-phosphopantetheinyl transferase